MLYSEIISNDEGLKNRMKIFISDKTIDVRLLVVLQECNIFKAR